MDRKYEKRISWKTQEINPLVTCSSKTCKTKCSRKDSKSDIYWNLEAICSNYWNGKNWDKPAQEERKIPDINTKELFILEDVKCSDD